MVMWQNLLKDIQSGNTKSLARAITLIENEISGYELFMQMMAYDTSARIIGITGPPGVGKSTLTDALIGALLATERKVAVLCVDPSSPFHNGALLGDRIRMSQWYTHKNVFIRSLATRGHMGGLHPKTYEITDVLKAAGFTDIIIETVGVGQNEIDIATIAATTIVVLAPEIGDSIQYMKAGLMEIAHVFVVNKSDMPGAEQCINNLQQMLRQLMHNNVWEVPIIATLATQNKGIEAMLQAIETHTALTLKPEYNVVMLANKAYSLLQEKCMKRFNYSALKAMLVTEMLKPEFNLYKWINELDMS
jgi:LAO/AO transport system kinase